MRGGDASDASGLWRGGLWEEEEEAGEGLAARWAWRQACPSLGVGEGRRANLRRLGAL